MRIFAKLHILRLSVACCSLSVQFLATPASGADEVTQPLRENIVGDYQLRGVREVGSGIRLSADGTYRFVFMVGSVDEIDEGRWSLESSSVALKSTASTTEPDIVFVRSEKGDFPGVRVAFEGENSAKASSQTHVALHSNDRRFVANEGFKGYKQSRIAAPPVQKITISYIGALRNYREFGFETTDPTHNYFVFKSSFGNLGFVRLNDAQLRVGSDELIFKLPHMREEFRYVRLKGKQ